MQAINDVGHVMGKKTIGEFVDGEMGLAALREIGVDFAQGDWIGPPLPFVVPPAATTRTFPVLASMAPAPA